MKRTPLRMKADPKLAVKVARPRKCKAPGCANRFTPTRALQNWCSFDCAAAIGLQALLKRDSIKSKEAKAAKKAEREKDRKKLRDLEPLSKFEKRAEKQVNLYVRLRDEYLGHGCVSCDKPVNWDGQWHASHYRSVGAASAVRFNLWNIHRACWICNKLYSGRIGDYRIVERVGPERVAWLESQNQTVRYTREYLERLCAVFAKKARRMAKRLEKRCSLLSFAQTGAEPA